MSTTILRTLAAAALCSALACGGSDGGPSYSDTIDHATATDAGHDAANWSHAVAEAMLDFDVSTEVPLVRDRDRDRIRYGERLIALMRRRYFEQMGRADLAAAPSPFLVSSVCVPTETGVDEMGDPIDTDHDGIPNDYKLDFGSACTDTEGDYTTTYSGWLRIRDVAGLFGYRFDAGGFRLHWTHLTDYETLNMNGFESGSFTSSAISTSTDMDWGDAWRYELVTAAPAPGYVSPMGTGAITRSLGATATYDPDGTITLGNPVPSGTLALQADYRVRYSGNAGTGGYRFTLRTTAALSIEATPCQGPVAGVIDGALNGNPDIGFTVTWTACNSYSVATRGTSDAVTVR